MHVVSYPDRATEPGPPRLTCGTEKVLAERSGHETSMHEALRAKSWPHIYAGSGTVIYYFTVEYCVAGYFYKTLLNNTYQVTATANLLSSSQGYGRSGSTALPAGA